MGGVLLQEWVETATFNGLGHLVTGSNDGSINVFDVESGNCISKRWNNGNNSHAVSRLGTSYPTHTTRHIQSAHVVRDCIRSKNHVHAGLAVAAGQRLDGRAHPPLGLCAGLLGPPLPLNPHPATSLRT